KFLLARTDATEPPEVLLDGGADHTSVAPDGRSVLFCRLVGSSAWDIWELPLQSKRVPRPWLATPADEGSPSFSSDGPFGADRSNESGRYAVYVRPYERAGAADPVW